MWGAPRTRLWGAALAALAIGLAACGDDDDEATARDAGDEKTQTDAPDLDRFLMRNGEEPGFRRGALPDATPQSGGTITGVNAYVKDMQLPAADARRLRSEGFISYRFEPIRGPRETAGITNAAVFKTAEGAKRNLARELRAQVGSVANARRFTVPGIPGSSGWTASEPKVGNVWWVQGRCVLVLGNQGPGPFVEPLSKGARAIYERTNGKCP
jgi:hypothetical protein